MSIENGFKVKNNKPEDQIEKADEGKSWPQVLTILIACLGPFTNGLLFSWPSPFILVITKDKENYDISEDEASYFTVIPPLGMITASLIFFKLNDILGRKRTLLLLAVPQLCFWVLTIFAKNVYMFYFARFVSGIGDAALFATLPVYIGEIATPKVRGFWGNSMTFFMYMGQFVINVVGSYFGVRETAYIFMTIPVIFVILFSVMPESPYYYIMKNRDEEAKEALKRLRRKQNVEKDFAVIKADVDRQMSESGNWKDLFMIKSNRKALIAGIFLRLSQQLGGISVFATYTQLIFEKSGGNVSPQLSSIIFMGLCCGLNFFSGILLEKIGRRKAYIYSMLGCCIVLFMESGYFYIDQFELANLSSINWIPLAGMILYVVFYSIGLGIVPTLMLGELFSTSIKVKGLCVLNLVFAMSVCFATSLFHVLYSNIGLYCPFLFFSICCLASTILSLYLVPETKGKTLEEIQQSLKGIKKKEKEVLEKS